jgi:hypothetical protein
MHHKLWCEAIASLMPVIWHVRCVGASSIGVSAGRTPIICTTNRGRRAQQRDSRGQGGDVPNNQYFQKTKREEFSYANAQDVHQYRFGFCTDHEYRSGKFGER